MRKALSLVGLAHIAKQTQGLFGIDEVKMFWPNGNELQVQAIDTMQRLLENYENQFTSDLVVEVSKDCSIINAKLREIGSGLRLTNQNSHDIAYGMSKETTLAQFVDAVLVKFPHPMGREVEAMMTIGSVFTYQGKDLIIVEQQNNIQFVIRPKIYADVTLEELIDPRYINEGTDDVRDCMIVIPKVAGGEAQEIDLSWLADSYTQDNVKFVEVKGEATYSIDDNGVSYTQTTAASMCLESMTTYAEIPENAYILDNDFVITAMYDSSVPLFSFAIDASNTEFELV